MTSRAQYSEKIVNLTTAIEILILKQGTTEAGRSQH